jgi:hypothetical protein
MGKNLAGLDEGHDVDHGIRIATAGGERGVNSG